jgi:hypothetical protein
VWAAAATASNLAFGPAMDHHDEERREVARALEHIRAAVDAARPGSIACVKNEIVPLFARFPGTVGVFVLYHPGDEIDGRRVRFVADRARLDATTGRARTLMVEPDACPAP